MLPLIRYIHLNPLRAKIVKTIEELDRYRWYGHSVLVGKEKSDWLDTEYVLRQFGRDKGKAIVAYRKFVQEGIQEGHRPDLVGGVFILGIGTSAVAMALKQKEAEENIDIIEQPPIPFHSFFWGRHFWGRGYFSVTSGNVTDEMIEEYINNHVDAHKKDYAENISLD